MSALLETAPLGSPLLGPEDPAPFTIIDAAVPPRSNFPGPVLLVCDHAGRAVPKCLGDLGVPPAEMERHVAYDIGAAAVTRLLAAAWGAPAVLATYSRLVLDLNRQLDDPTAMPEISDGTVVPANRGCGAAELRRRGQALHVPYHGAVDGQIMAALAAGQAPAVISMHSMTPVMRGVARPWHISVLWDRDGRIAEPLMANLRAQGLVVGDNEPYSGRDHHGFTVETHCTPRGLPNVLIELRQDLVATEAGQQEWAERLLRAFAPILSDPALYRLPQL
ncbi:MAG TPA: N-formylglutamate amidohydrolase [Alphaproteobacteria bacterium]|nr:N-formylglutamate amidohydrolase [Alphaproteobacteria bacterium]